MSFKDALRRSVLEGFAANDMPTAQILMILLMAFLIGLFLFFIYRFVNRSSLYDRGFHVSMAMLSVVTAGIIVAMQSSIVISLGMVGALSIVRFRTAIKDPMDLLFLFWSIGEGIICGAGLFERAVLVALVVTAGIFILEYLPVVKKPLLLIVGSQDPEYEDMLLDCLKTYCSSYKVKSRNLKKTGLDMVLEVRTAGEKELMEALRAIEPLEHISLLAQDGEVRV